MKKIKHIIYVLIDKINKFKRKNMKLKTAIMESIIVKKTNAIKYFKQIQKATKSRSYDIEKCENGYTVDFIGGKIDFKLLIGKVKKLNV